MNKRIASLLLAVAMIASLGIMAMAVDQKLVNPTGAAKTYTDVPATYHFYTEIQNVTRAGLFQGTTDTTFSPYAYMSRGQFVMVLARLEGIAGNGGVAQESRVTDTVFTDVANTYRFAAAIKWATDNSIVNGYTETAADGTSIRTFRPRDAISRAQIAAMLHRYMEYKKYTLKEVTSIPAQFTDYETQVTLADGTISTACPQTFRSDLDYGRRYGLIRGYSDGTYRPNIPVGRAQVAAMLDRIVLNVTRRSSGGGGGGGGYTTYYDVSATDNNSAIGIVTLYYGNEEIATESKDAREASNSTIRVKVDIVDNSYTLDTVTCVNVNDNNDTKTVAMSAVEGQDNQFEGTFRLEYNTRVQVTYKKVSDVTTSDGLYTITLSGTFTGEAPLKMTVSDLTGSDGFGEAMKSLNDQGGYNWKNTADADNHDTNADAIKTALFENMVDRLVNASEEGKFVEVTNQKMINKTVDSMTDSVADDGVDDFIEKNGTLSYSDTTNAFYNNVVETVRKTAEDKIAEGGVSYTVADVQPGTFRWTGGSLVVTISSSEKSKITSSLKSALDNDEVVINPTNVRLDLDTAVDKSGDVINSATLSAKAYADVAVNGHFEGGNITITVRSTSPLTFNNNASYTVDLSNGKTVTVPVSYNFNMNTTVDGVDVDFAKVMDSLGVDSMENKIVNVLKRGFAGPNAGENTKAGVAKLVSKDSGSFIRFNGSNVMANGNPFAMSGADDMTFYTRYTDWANTDSGNFEKFIEAVFAVRDGMLQDLGSSDDARVASLKTNIQRADSKSLKVDADQVEKVANFVALSSMDDTMDALWAKIEGSTELGFGTMTFDMKSALTGTYADFLNNFIVTDDGATVTFTIERKPVQ